MTGALQASTTGTVAVHRWRAATALSAWAVAVASVVLAATYLPRVRTLGLATVGAEVTPADIADQVHVLLLATLGATVVVRGRSGAYGALLLLTGCWLAVVQGAREYALWATFGDPGLPFAALAIGVQELFVPAFASQILLLPALFPDGRTVDRWRRPVLAATVLWVVFTVLWSLTDRPADNGFLDLDPAIRNPMGLLPLPVFALQAMFGLLSIGSVVVAAGSLRARWRTSLRETRQQVTWVLVALGVSVGGFALLTLDLLVVEVAEIDHGLSTVVDLIVSSTWVLLTLALGLGVLRFRLYQVDLVANRTVVYVLMSVGVVGAYVSLLIAIPALFGLEERGASLLATVLVAVAFAPARNRVQRWVSRRLFGRRDDPLDVLASLGEVLSGSGGPGATLATLAETVATSLKLPGAAIDLRDGQGWHRRARHGSLGETPEVVELRHQGEVVGRLLAARRSPGEALHADDRRLLGNIAVHAAALAHALRLNVALQRSREDLVLAREEERRRLRRDLHDGLGPALASQTFRLDAALEQLGPGDGAAAQHLRDLKEQNRELVADIRRLVYELRPPALDELGLVGALAAHTGGLADGLHVTVETEPDPLGDLPAAVEVAAYRIATEAVTNVVRHAEASTCRVLLQHVDGALRVTVEDDGVGVRAVTQPGVGMSSMRERVDELGGALEIVRGDVDGTRVTATLPTAADVDRRGPSRPVRAGAAT